MKSFKVEISNLLSRLRVNAKLNQSDAGQLLNASRAAISEIEGGRREVTLQEMMLLLEGYKIPLCYGLVYTLLAFQGSGHTLQEEDQRVLRIVMDELTRQDSSLALIDEVRARD